MKKTMRWVLLALILVFLCSCSTASPAPTPENGTDNPSTDTPITEVPSTTADNPLLDEHAKENHELLPRSISSGHKWVQSLQGKTLTMYYAAENDAFDFNNGSRKITEDGWLKAIAAKYDIRIQVIRKDPRSSLAAQRLAMLSSKSLDILSFTPSQLPYAVGMTADATDLMKEMNVEYTDFLNQTVLTYGNRGNRFFTPAGVARNLWYTTGGSSNPRKLADSGLWNLQAFAGFVSERTKVSGNTVNVYGYEAHDFKDMLASLGTPIVNYDPETGFVSNIDEAAQKNMLTLQQINSKTGSYYNGQSLSRDKAPSLVEQTLAMRYGQTPFLTEAEEYPAFDWAPLPTAERHQGSGALSACAPVLALPKNGPQNQSALCAALLWSARFADAHHDLLRFTYGMSFDSWTAYYHATNRQLQVVYSDDSNAVALRRLVGAPTFEEADLADLREDCALYCINANARVSHE